MYETLVVFLNKNTLLYSEGFVALCHLVASRVCGHLLERNTLFQLLCPRLDLGWHLHENIVLPTFDALCLAKALFAIGLLERDRHIDLGRVFQVQQALLNHFESLALTDFSVLNIRALELINVA